MYLLIFKQNNSPSLVLVALHWPILFMKYNIGHVSSSDTNIKDFHI